jgi:transcriptional regulator with XRE-family HTH domain
MLDVPIAFGRVLLRVRKERGLSQEALAGEAGLQRKYISLLEKAEYQPKISTVFRLAEALGYAPSDFIALVDEERNRRK